MEFEEARNRAEQLARETNLEYAVRQSYETGEFFVCAYSDGAARNRGSLEHLTRLIGNVLQD